MITFWNLWPKAENHQVKFVSYKFLKFYATGARVPRVPEYFTGTRDTRALATEQSGKRTTASAK